MIYVWLRANTRLANWMSVYAAAVSANCGEVKFYATDAKVIRLYQDYKDEVFHNTELVTSLPKELPVCQQKNGYTPIVAPDGTEDFLLSGYFQSERYYDKEKIRGLLGPCQERSKEIQEKFGGWLSRPNVTGISVRRTDYLKLPHTNPFCGKQYYRECLSRIPQCNDFIVCSDDIAWCKKWFPKAFPKKNFLFVENQPVLTQLYVHSFCQNNIISNSSFALWSAWLNPNPYKRVFAPSLWTGMAYGWAPRTGNGPYFEGTEVIETHYTPLQFLHGVVKWGGAICYRKLANVKHFLLGSIGRLKGKDNG